MQVIIDKLLLFAGGCILLFFLPVTVESVASMLAALTLSSLGSFMEYRRVSLLFALLFTASALFFPLCCLYLPLLYYDVFFSSPPGWWALCLLGPAVQHEKLSPLYLGLLALLLLTALLLKKRTQSEQELKKESLRTRDAGRELSLLLERKNRDLMEKQDYEIRLATLNERNRIAREIHDSVGHMLSRSILQTGALLAVNRDEMVNEHLLGLKDTLSQAMDSIRESVHDLHDDSVDLSVQITALLQEFTFCPVSLDYDMESDVEKDVKYCFLAVVKEALNNIMKHSNATKASITLREHPALYQLIIRDNGTTAAQPKQSDGLGLRNMAERVEALQGHFHVTFQDGVTLFLSIPKEVRHANPNRG